jgi:hypothetical protein
MFKMNKNLKFFYITYIAIMMKKVFLEKISNELKLLGT